MLGAFSIDGFSTRPKISVILLSIDSSFAKCNFKSANYINELSIPKKIRSIKIDVHKSGQFNKNFARIVVSKSENIPPTLKKNFSNISVVDWGDQPNFDIIINATSLGLNKEDNIGLNFKNIKFIF
mgnify:CR=1 FL=1